MKKAQKKSLWETFKFVTRLVVLVGLPAFLAELAVQKPEWGGWIGVALAVWDKYRHENPNTPAKGLLPW